VTKSSWASTTSSWPGAMARAEAHTIGEVINLLREEFPDVTVSKLRFLEGQKLIEPRRSPSGYREFSVSDLERIRYILRQQRDHYLPLKVIKSKLAAWQRGDDPVAELPEGPPPEAYFASSGVSMTPPELAKASSLTRKQVAALVEHGVIEPMVLDDGKEVFRDEELIVARAAYRLLRHGLEPRHLRSFRLAADREVELLRQLTAAQLRHRNPDSRQQAAEILADCAQAGRELSETMVRAHLRRLLEA